MIAGDYSEKAKELDRLDPLRPFRAQFFIDDPSVIYLDGNSLGRLPMDTIEKVNHVVQQEWGVELIHSWNQSWYEKSVNLGDKIASIIGADKGEVIVSDNTSTNLFKLAYGALSYQKGRKEITTDEFNFPSDVYILEGLVKQFDDDYTINYINSRDGISISDGEIRESIGAKTALITLSHVAFKSAFTYDMHLITKMAHNHGALILWDLSHSVGAVPVDVKKSNVDLAVGCTYKYLNGGPGAPAFLYVRKDLQEKLNSPIQGWFGTNNPFEFNLNYAPASGIRRFLTGTPPIVSLTGMELGLDLVMSAGINAIREKSVQLSSFFIELFNKELADLGFSLASPVDPNRRGSHISLKHAEAFRIIKARMDKSIDGKSIIPDFRSPDNLRFGFAPLYNTFEEVYRTIEKLKKIADLNLYQNYDSSMPDFT